MSEHRVDESRNNHGHNDVGAKPHTLRDGSGDNGRSRRTEHHLKQEKDGKPWRPLAHWCPKVRRSNPPAPGQPEHEGETECPVQDDGDPKVHEILDGDVDRILCPRQPGLQAQKPGLHHEDEGRADHDPQDIPSRPIHHLCHPPIGSVSIHQADVTPCAVDPGACLE